MAAWVYEFYLLVLKVSLTGSLSSLVRDTFQHSKIKFVSSRGHEISSIYYYYYYYYFHPQLFFLCHVDVKNCTN